MKSIILKSVFMLCFLQAFIHTKAISQEHFILPESEWYYTSYQSGYNDPTADFVHYKNEKDTVVDGQQCRYIHSSKGDHKVMYEADEKVYYYRDNQFYVLYDFDVLPDDTTYLDMRVETFVDNDGAIETIDTVLNVPSVVQDVDTIEESGVSLKQVTISIDPEADFLENAQWPDPITYTERIGYPHDGFIPLIIKGIGTAEDKQERLRCYADDVLDYTSVWWEGSEKPCDHKFTTYREVIKPDTSRWYVAWRDLSDQYMDTLTINDGENGLYDVYYRGEYFQNQLTFAGQVRSSETNDKLWYLEEPGAESVLIYDMSLDEGDTFFLSSNHYTDTLEVKEVFEKDNRKHVRFASSPGWAGWEEPLEFIEGVGPNQSLIWLWDERPLESFTVCMFHNNERVYSFESGYFEDCNYKVTSLEKTSESFRVTVLPESV